MKPLILCINDNTNKNELWDYRLRESGKDFDLISFTHPNYLIEIMEKIDRSRPIYILFDKRFASTSLLESKAFKRIKNYFSDAYHLVSSGEIEENTSVPGFLGSVGPRPISFDELIRKTNSFVKE